MQPSRAQRAIRLATTVIVLERALLFYADGYKFPDIYHAVRSR